MSWECGVSELVECGVSELGVRASEETMMDQEMKESPLLVCNHLFQIVCIIHTK